MYFNKDLDLLSAKVPKSKNLNRKNNSESNHSFILKDLLTNNITESEINENRVVEKHESVNIDPTTQESEIPESEVDELMSASSEIPTEINDVEKKKEEKDAPGNLPENKLG